MKNSLPSNSPGPQSAAEAMELSPWQQLRRKRIAHMTLPLLIMATIVEFVILATGWKYQKAVCVPQGMGVTFFGIGPIGATILAVELLKLPLAIWTASRTGWQKTFMLWMGLPLICVLTFQLVKDMAVYEMGTAMAPATRMLEKAMAEEIKISQLKGSLGGIEEKKNDREKKLAELAAKETKAKADLQDSLKRVEETRQDAINLTDYQKKELSEVDARQANIIKQFNADTEQLTKVLTDLRARREVEVARASKWNADEARIDNAYKQKMADYTNRKNTYDKELAEYNNAGFVKRALLKEPLDPGVPPVRESNTNLAPTLVVELDAQIKAKEGELSALNVKRRERVAQVDLDARGMRDEFDRRSRTKREETDKKRDELLAALAASDAQWKAERQQIDKELGSAVQNVDGIRGEIDGARKRADGFYEQREAAIRNTQVHRIATTVEIVRGLVKGERPVSIKSTARERGDLLTDQISMVRIWVYPVLAFIVAFLPTLMVEIGFSTVFKPEKERPQYRLGFLGRRLHWLYTRAGRHKILRAERLAGEASAQIAGREQALADKEAELRAIRELLDAARGKHEGQLKKREEEWVAKFTDLADSLNRAVVEKDALRDLQKSEVERQIQLRQNAWSDRLSQMRQELDDQRAAAESERTALMQEHQKKLIELTGDCKTQIIQSRRQMSDGEMASAEKLAKLSHDLKEAIHARDTAEAQLKYHADSLAVKLTQAREDAARELDRAVRQEKNRFERQQSESDKAQRQREDEFEHKLKQREQELTLAFDTRLAEEKSKLDQHAGIRATEFDRQLEARVREVDANWSRELQRREDVAQIKLSQREQQLQAQADIRFREVQAQAEEQQRRREAEFERQFEARSREAESRLRDELQQKEMGFLEQLKQREQELLGRAGARESELQDQWTSDSRAREEGWQRETEARVRAAETRMGHELKQKEEMFQLKLRQREQQLETQFESRQAELQSRWNQELRRRDGELADAKQREQHLASKMAAQVEAHQIAERKWQTELVVTRDSIGPLKALLERAEKERDEARESASEGLRQMQDLKKKSIEAFSLLNGWENGGPPHGGRS